MKEHSILDCDDKEVARIRAIGEVCKLQSETANTLSFKGDGLPDSDIEYLRRKTEVMHAFSLVHFEYLVGLIWEVNQRLKRERGGDHPR